MTITFSTIDEFRAAAGADLGAGPWLEVDQERISAFADVTEDWQWIHVDTERAAASDVGSTIAHGYLTLSLVPRLSSGIFDFTGENAETKRALVNWGLGAVAWLVVGKLVERVVRP